MIYFDFQEYCSGCSACANVCPEDAITMKAGELGFLFPVIDESKCISCGLCDRVCPHINKEKIIQNEDFLAGVWLYSSEEDDAKMRSASGAVFYELAKAYLANGDYVVGCVWDEKLEAEHIVTNRIEDMYRMQGSKYVQSRVGDSYEQALDLLKKGKKVLFSGTPCQVVAMHNAVMQYKCGELRNNLLTLGVICHGVPAPEVWESYKEYLEKKNKSKLVEVNFRDKSRAGYKLSHCMYKYESGAYTYIPTFLPSSKYMEANIVYNLSIRRSCNHCDCKGVNDAIDIIVGDWYAECTGEGALGTSCIVAFTQHGKEETEHYLQRLRDFDYASVLKDNRFIKESVSKNPRSDEFVKNLSTDMWDHVERFYPKKYKLKKLLVRLGIYIFLKRIMY